LRAIAADFEDPRVGVVTCPYRAVPARSVWSLLAALTQNTEFWCGALVARMLEGVKFAVGPTMALRRDYLDAIGGFAAVGDYLAEDYVLGQWAERYGYRAALSAHVVDHHIGNPSFQENFGQRVRWARSTRRSRPWGYWGQLFTNPLPLALVLLAGQAAPLAALVAVGRAAVAGAVGLAVLRDPLTRKYWWLAPVADVVSLVVWVLGFFGRTVEWRGRRYRLSRDGRLLPIQDKS
jgi:ceramide glucosyltransferase